MSKPGSIPYGEKRGEAEVLDRMRALRSEGFGPAEITRTLNDEGYRNRRGNEFSPQWVLHLLNKYVDADRPVAAEQLYQDLVDRFAEIETVNSERVQGLALKVRQLQRQYWISIGGLAIAVALMSFFT